MNRNHPFHDLLKPFGIRIDLHGKPVHDPCDQSVDKAHVFILLKYKYILYILRSIQTYMAAVINSGHISLVVRLMPVRHRLSSDKPEPAHIVVYQFLVTDHEAGFLRRLPGLLQLHA